MTKVLFICKSNFGRSQMAEALFNSMTSKHHAISAGTLSGRTTGHVLLDFPEHHFLLECMAELGLDISHRVSKLLTPQMVDESDLVISMAEKETWPHYLKQSKKVTFWPIEDMADQSLKKFRTGRDQITQKVKELLCQLD